MRIDLANVTGIPLKIVENYQNTNGIKARAKAVVRIILDYASLQKREKELEKRIEELERNQRHLDSLILKIKQGYRAKEELKEFLE